MISCSSIFETILRIEIMKFFFQIKVGGGSKFDTLHDRNGKVCLFINRMTEQDVGVYTCKAWNEHGETVKKIRLLEAGK